jgi:hypothetical protein
LLSLNDDLGKALMEADESIVARPDTEDEDTEQKIINEGMSPLLVTRLCH